VNIDLFPGSIVKTIVTSKTFTPDLPGEATGGSVNILTKGVPDKSFRKFKMGLGYETLTTGNSKFLSYNGGGTGLLGTLNDRRIPILIKDAPLPQNVPGTPEAAEDRAFRDRINETLDRELGTKEKTAPPNISGELTIGERSMIGKWPAGFLASFDYRKDYRFDDLGRERRYQFGLGGQVTSVVRDSNVTRGLESLNSSLLIVGGVQPPGGEIKLTLFTNVAADDRASQRFGPVGSAEENTIGLRESIAYTERRLKVLQIAGEQELGPDHPWKIEWFGTYNLSSQDEPDQRFVETLTTPTKSEFFLPGALPIPPFRRYWRELEDSRYNFGASIEVPILHGSNPDVTTKVKFGGSFDFSDRSYRADSFAYNTGQAIGQSGSKPLQPGNTIGDEFLYGNPPVFSAASPEAQSVYLYRFVPTEFYTAEQVLPAGFFMFNSDITSKLSTSIGARYEGTALRSQASSIVDIDDPNIRILFLTPEQRLDQNLVNLLATNPEAARNNPIIQERSRARIDSDVVLPSINFRYKLAENMSLRTAWSQTVARPSFKEISPILIRNAETGEDFIGNPDLRISKIDNYDLRLEWAPASGGLLAASVFAKEIQNPIERGFGAGIEQFVNQGKGRLRGFEIEADKGLAFLSPELKEFSIGGNYTFLYSSVDRGTASFFGRSRRLQGQPDYLLNFNVSYDNAEFGLYTGLFLNVTGGYLDAAGIGGFDPDIYIRPISTVNFVLQYNLTKDLKLTFRANNLTQAQIERRYNSPGNPLFSLQNTGISYSLGGELTW
ncbi:MAG: TonB-dependent receptor, partial [Opitutaceae bacterium]